LILSADDLFVALDEIAGTNIQRLNDKGEWETNSYYVGPYLAFNSWLIGTLRTQFNIVVDEKTYSVAVNKFEKRWDEHSRKDCDYGIVGWISEEPSREVQMRIKLVLPA
jgi:hypothetical protein